MSSVRGTAYSSDTLDRDSPLEKRRASYTFEERTKLGDLFRGTTPHSFHSSVPVFIDGKGPLLEREIAAGGEPSGTWEVGGASASRKHGRGPPGYLATTGGVDGFAHR